MTTAAARTRMSPDTRREQLLELGVELFATRSLDELNIDVLAEAAGISRGLLYHYFGSKTEFHEAVVRRSVEHLIEVTAPVDAPDVLTRLSLSLEKYVDYVVDHHTAYVSIVRAAGGTNENMREIYEQAVDALVGRIFTSSTPEELAEVGVPDTPAMRLLARGWAAYAELVLLGWIEDNRGLSKAELIETLSLSLGGMAAALPAPTVVE